MALVSAQTDDHGTQVMRAKRALKSSYPIFPNTYPDKQKFSTVNKNRIFQKFCHPVALVSAQTDDHGTQAMRAKRALKSSYPISPNTYPDKQKFIEVFFTIFVHKNCHSCAGRNRDSKPRTACAN